MLGALLAASSKQPASEPSAPSPSPRSTTTSAASAGNVAESRGYNWQTAPSTATLAAAETGRGRTSMASYQQPSSEPATDASAKKSFLKVVDHQNSFLKVIDHQNQPSSRSPGTGNISESSYNWQSPPGRGDPAGRSRADELDYCGPMSAADYQRFPSVEDARRVDLPRHLAGDERYSGRYDSSAHAYRSAGDIGDKGRYYSDTGDRSKFWNEMSAYCAEYEARVSQRDGSQLPQRLPTDNLSRRQVQESLASARPRDVVDIGGAARHYSAEELVRRYRLGVGDAELRQAQADYSARYWAGQRGADYEAAAAMRGRSTHETRAYYPDTSTDRSSHR